MSASTISRSRHIFVALVLALMGLTAYSLAAVPPAQSPPLGLCLPAEFVRARDSDTIEWRVSGSAFIWASRLINVWSPELHRGTEQQQAIAAAGKRYVEDICKGHRLTVFIPLPRGEQPLKALTFDRIPSYVWLDETDLLNELIVKEGYASSQRNGLLGK